MAVERSNTPSRAPLPLRVQRGSTFDSLGFPRLALCDCRAYAWDVRLDAPTVVIALLLLGACGEEAAPPREWQPEDHQPPTGGVDPSRAEPPSDSEEVDVERAAAGLWRVSCAPCHGVDGRGGGPAAAPGATVPDLTTPELQDRRTDEEWANVIRNGSGTMPGFGSQINERGIEALVAHTRKLRRD